jgi:hypothetical protein
MEIAADATPPTMSGREEREPISGSRRNAAADHVARVRMAGAAGTAVATGAVAGAVASSSVPVP